MKNFFKNWRTTSAGMGVIITGILACIKGDYMTGAGTIAGGLGLLGAKDFNVSGGTQKQSSVTNQ